MPLSQTLPDARCPLCSFPQVIRPCLAQGSALWIHLCLLENIMLQVACFTPDATVTFAVPNIYSLLRFIIKARFQVSCIEVIILHTGAIIWEVEGRGSGSKG